MDDRKPYIYKTTDFGATWTKINGNIPTGHPLDYMLSIVGQPEQEGHAVRRHRPRVLLLDERRRHVDAVQGRAAARAGELDHRRDALPRRRDLDLRPRPLHPAEHHASSSRRDRPRRPRRARPSSTSRRRSSAWRAASTSRPNRPHFLLALATAPAGPVKMEILDRGGKVVKTQMVSLHAGPERRQLGSHARRADAGRAEDDAAREPAHLGRDALPEHQDPPHHALGHHAVRPAFRWRRPASTRCASPSTAQTLHDSRST